MSYFSNDDRNFVVTDPFISPSWNYLYSPDGKFHIEINQRGRGDVFFCSKDINLVSKGRDFFLFDNTSNERWSLTAGAKLNEHMSYACTHSPGQTSFKAVNLGITSSLKISAAVDLPAEIDRLVIQNDSDETKELSLIACHFIELAGGDSGGQVEITSYDSQCGALFCQRRHYLSPPYKHAAFFLANRQPDSFCGSLADFNPSSDVAMPYLPGCVTSILPNKNAYATSPIMALQFHLSLKPGQIQQIDFVLALSDDMEHAAAEAKVFGKNQFCTQYEKSREFFNSFSARTLIATGDRQIDAAMNIWTRLQLNRQVCSARCATLHNWRNNLQDSQAWIPYDSSLARNAIVEACSLAHEDGFIPRSSSRFPHIPNTMDQMHNDIATWLVYCTSQYFCETYDASIFDAEINYANGKNKSTVLQCLFSAIQWLLDHTGSHGMILFFDGDWSDPMEEAGKKRVGESPWTTMALINALSEFIPILNILGHYDRAADLTCAVQQLTNAVNENAWDGDWYIRGITDAGVKFCTKADPDANVSLLMQAWAIISGVADKQRIEKILNTVDKYNKTEFGPIVYGPPFLKPRTSIGRETFKQPGTGENGSVYSHAAMMWAVAELIAQRPSEALKVIKQVLPIKDDFNSELWFPNFYHGPHSPYAGQSSNIHGSGAPAWLFKAICEYMLGVRAKTNGLQIAPCLPPEYKNLKFYRLWRNSRYEITFYHTQENTRPYITLDGTPLDNNILPFTGPNKLHKVAVTL